MKIVFKILKTFFMICLLLTLMNTIAYSQEKTIKIGFVGDFSEVNKGD